MMEYKLYTSCTELPMLNFIDCLYYSKFHRLIVSGFPPPDEILRTWKIIYEEYMNLSADSDCQTIFSLQLNVQRRNITIELLNDAIEILQLGNQIEFQVNNLSQLLNDAFKLLDIEIHFKLETAPYAKEIDQLLICIRHLQLEIHETEIEMKSFLSNCNPGSKKEQIFHRIASILRKNGFPARLHLTTVTEFLSDLQQYKEMSKHERRNI